MVLAGNVPAMVLGGLARLFKGVEQTLDRVIYGTFFAGPAAVI
jgi:hypothetical protein